MLAVLLALTSVQMAVARGSAAPAGTMVLCVGGGVVTVSVDAEGNPTGPVHLCPDCVMSLIVALPDAAILPPHDAGSQRQHFGLRALAEAGRRLGAARVRGPPTGI